MLTTGKHDYYSSIISFYINETHFPDDEAKSLWIHGVASAATGIIILLTNKQARVHASRKFSWLRWLEDNSSVEPVIPEEPVVVEEAANEETAGGEGAVEETAVVAFEAAEDTDDESALERSLENDDALKEGAAIGLAAFEETDVEEIVAEEVTE